MRARPLFNLHASDVTRAKSVKARGSPGCSNRACAILSPSLGFGRHRVNREITTKVGGVFGVLVTHVTFHLCSNPHTFRYFSSLFISRSLKSQLTSSRCRALGPRRIHPCFRRGPLGIHCRRKSHSRLTRRRSWKY